MVGRGEGNGGDEGLGKRGDKGSEAGCEDVRDGKMGRKEVEAGLVRVRKIPVVDVRHCAGGGAWKSVGLTRPSLAISWGQDWERS